MRRMPHPAGRARRTGPARAREESRSTEPRARTRVPRRPEQGTRDTARQPAARARGHEVTSEWIGLAVLERLRVLDPVSYVRFASVYKGFDDLGDFEREVGELQKTTPPKAR